MDVGAKPTAKLVSYGWVPAMFRGMLWTIWGACLVIGGVVLISPASEPRGANFGPPAVAICFTIATAGLAVVNRD